MLEIYLIGYGVILVFMSLVWLLSLPLQNSSIVDIFWGTGFVVAAGTYFLLAEGHESRKWLVLALTAVWGLRLSIYLLWRNGLPKEDFRYRKWREETGTSYWWKSYFRVNLLQGTILWLVSAPLLAAQLGDHNLNVLDLLGIMVWAVGLLFESVGDFQLARFKSDPANKGQVLDTGLWRYTRHPNYFGDAVTWIGFYLIALAAGGWWSFYGTALMVYLLMKVSGVAMLERTLVQTKPQYAEYIRRTNAFFPGRPKS